MRSPPQPTASTFGAYLTLQFPRVPVDTGYLLGCFTGLLIHAHVVSEFMIGLEKMKARSGKVSQSARALMLEDIYRLYDHCVGQDMSSKAEKCWGILRYVSVVLGEQSCH